MRPARARLDAGLHQLPVMAEQGQQAVPAGIGLASIQALVGQDGQRQTRIGHHAAS